MAIHASKPHQSCPKIASRHPATELPPQPMSYRMPFPEPILPLTLLGMVTVWIWVAVSNFFFPAASQIHHSHTQHTLSQIAERLAQVDDSHYPTTLPALLALLRASPMDWNTGGIDGDQILDGWNQPITTTYDASTKAWTFRSHGEDAQLGTADDIERTTPSL
jgi:hypothetical protein